MVNVYNKRDGSHPGAVYIGRPGRWGNPFPLGSEADRPAVLKQYRNWLYSPEQASFRQAATDQLQGRDLTCWCAPKACHGDILAELVNREEPPVMSTPIVHALTGHRPPKLGLTYAGNGAIDRRVRNAIRTHLTTTTPDFFISGMALGVDMLGAEAALEAGIRLTAAVPFPDQDARWPAASRERYDLILNRAYEVHYIWPDYDPKAFQDRNQWMVDHSSVLLAFWDGSPGGTANCLKAAAYRQALDPDYRIIRYRPSTELKGS